MNIHKPVLLTESITALAIKPDGHYLDATFGRGGHSRAILASLGPNGRLVSMDKDPDAIREGERLAKEDQRFTICHASFAELAKVAKQSGLDGKLDGVLFDLGVSSPQLDDAQRGFSFLQEGPLDMRMNPSFGVPVREWLERADEQEIADVLWQYGEERYAKRIARAIKMALPLHTTTELSVVVTAANPAWEKHKHPATRVFQALRIKINNELEELKVALASCVDVLAVQGRLAVITFHSLEDRIVKQFLQQHEQGPQLPREVPVMAEAFSPRLCRVGKAITPTAQEIAENPRARSARLRIGEKLK